MKAPKIISWSRNAKKQLARIESHSQARIKKRINELKNESAPRADIRKLSVPDDHLRLRVGDYRIVFMLLGEDLNECHILSVKRRTTTTYLHEEEMPYGCSVY